MKLTCPGGDPWLDRACGGAVGGGSGCGGFGRALTALVGLATNAKGPALAGPLGSSVNVVAGAGCIEAPTLQVAA
jgi:hypothetical protein